MYPRLPLLFLILFSTLTACGEADDSSVPLEPAVDPGPVAPNPDTSADLPEPADVPDGVTPEDLPAPADADAPPDVAPLDPGLEPEDVAPPPPDVADVPSSPQCPDGQICVDGLPFTHSGDTGSLPPGVFDSYGCKPSADESGPEQIYRVAVPEAGFLSAAVYDAEGVDVDVHILSELDPGKCVDRGHHHARTDVGGAGIWYVVVDTWVGDDGEALVGPYQVDIGFAAPSSGPCGMEIGIMKRVGDGGDHLPMPATGPIVLEAHLVTQEEPKPYPTTSTDELAAHYVLSQSQTGFVMYRSQKWAPLEGGSFYGAGIGSPTLFPVVDEGWYVNMYWTKESRPDRGTRMIFRVPGTDRAVVVAAGYETGPGNLKHIGGTPEETHFYLGTGHLSALQLGIATDQTLEFGPRRCTD